MFFCPSDPYRGLTTDWGVSGGQNKARICHYFAVAGSTEGSNTGILGSAPTYSHCNWHDGMFYNDSDTRVADIQDGLSNTAMLSETWGRTSVNHDKTGESSRAMNLHSVVYLDWTPNSNHSNPWKSNGFHPGGVFLAYADGSVHFVTDTVQLNVFKASATISGGEAGL